MRTHLQNGDYKSFVYHTAVLQLTFMAIGEESARELITEAEMQEIVADSMGDIAGATTLLLRDLQNMKAEENGSAH